MSSAQQTGHESKFDKAWHTQEDCQQQEECVVAGCLSDKPEEAGLFTVPSQQVKHVFNKAQALLSKENTIVSAPGSNGMAFMVESHTSKRPHYVMAEKTGKVTYGTVQLGRPLSCVHMLCSCGRDEAETR